MLSTAFSGGQRKKMLEHGDTTGEWDAGLKRLLRFLAIFHATGMSIADHKLLQTRNFLANQASHWVAIQELSSLRFSAEQQIWLQRWLPIWSSPWLSPLRRGGLAGRTRGERRTYRTHYRTARRMYRICRHQGGIYLKLGQYISTLTFIVPDVYCAMFSTLVDNARPRPFSQVDKVLHAELPKDILERLTEMETTPMAVGSIAQVHRAKFDGRPVAVKVQHMNLQRDVSNDVAALKWVTRTVGLFFPSWDFSFLSDIFEMNLMNEIDFRQEATNASRMSRLVALYPPRPSSVRVRIPKIEWSASTERVLTMELITAAKKVDVRTQLELPKVAAALSDLLGSMLFVHGLVHCDPHQGNLLIRDGDNGGKELVLLDHGMYRRVSEGFRKDFCDLWTALVTQDAVLGGQVCEDLGISAAFGFDVLSVVLTHRLTRPNGEKANSLIDAVDLQWVNDFLKTLPRDLLWVFRMINMTRGLHFRLGGSNSDRIVSFAARALEGAITFDGGSRRCVQRMEARRTMTTASDVLSKALLSSTVHSTQEAANFISGFLTAVRPRPLNLPTVSEVYGMGLRFYLGFPTETRSRFLDFSRTRILAKYIRSRLLWGFRSFVILPLFRLRLSWELWALERARKILECR